MSLSAQWSRQARRNWRCISTSGAPFEKYGAKLSELLGSRKTLGWFAPSQVGSSSAGATDTVMLSRLELAADRWVDAYRWEVVEAATLGVVGVPLVFADSGNHPAGLFLSGPLEPLHWVQGSERYVPRFVIPA